MRTFTEINKEIEKSFAKVKSRIVEEVIDDLIPMISEKVEDWTKDKLYDISEFEQVDYIDSIMDIKDEMIEQCRVDIMKRIKIKQDKNNKFYKTNKMKEIELALKWFEMNDISAYNTDEDLFVKVNNDTHILVSRSEISYRADLYKEHDQN